MRGDHKPHVWGRGRGMKWLELAIGALFLVGGIASTIFFVPFSHALAEFALRSSPRPDIPIPRLLLAVLFCFGMIGVGTLSVLYGFGVEV